MKSSRQCLGGCLAPGDLLLIRRGVASRRDGDWVRVRTAGSGEVIAGCAVTGGLRAGGHHYQLLQELEKPNRGENKNL